MCTYVVLLLQSHVIYGSPHTALIHWRAGQFKDAESAANRAKNLCDTNAIGTFFLGEREKREKRENENFSYETFSPPPSPQHHIFSPFYWPKMESGKNRRHVWNNLRGRACNLLLLFLPYFHLNLSLIEHWTCVLFAGSISPSLPGRMLYGNYVSKHST